MTKPPQKRRSAGDELPVPMSQLSKGDNTMENEEIQAIYLEICGNIADNVRHMNALISDKKIEPALKVKMLATSITALTEVRELYKEMLEVFKPKGSDTSISE